MGKKIKKSYLLLFLIVFVLSFAFLYFTEERRDQTQAGELFAHKAFIENIDGSYTGDVVGFDFEGYGKFEYLDGTIYTGDWKDSYLNGNGEMVFPKVGKYTGDYKNSKREGNGVFKWDNGDSYEGVSQTKGY